MRQKKILKELYQACVEHNKAKIAELRREEFRKIFQRRAKSKPFTTRWTLVRI